MQHMAHRGALALVGVSLVVSMRLSAQSRTSTPTKTVVAKELWRVDGTESGQPFGSVRDILALPNGDLWVLDYKDQQIRRYDRDGRALGVIGRKGSGPGEMRNANGMVLHGDGTVWVNDPSNARFSVFRADGRYATQHAAPITGYGYRWEAWYDASTKSVIDLDFSKRGVMPGRRRVSATGTVSDRFELPACRTRLDLMFEATAPKESLQGLYPFSMGGGAAGDRQGALWCAPVDDDRAVKLRIGSGDTLARTTVSVPALPVSTAEREAEIARVQKSVAAYPRHTFDPAKVPTKRPPIAALWVDDDDRVWLEHGRPDGAATSTFDVFNSSGAHLGRVLIPSRRSTFLPIRAKGDRLWIPVIDADDVPALALFRVALAPR
ncbi:MAG: hypothetical protein K2R93_08175 [Gemmatimonadaceae bacterium]|nr:hypothetical protein [Gemmatimonadaceae bacterium]